MHPTEMEERTDALNPTLTPKVLGQKTHSYTL